MAEGTGELMVDVRNTFADALTLEKLFIWHEMLFKQSRRINAGAWRKDEAPMQVISGATGKEKIHFEAPASSHVPGEMKRFIQWFNETAPGGINEIKKAPVRSANGRIGRAIAEKALSQTIGRPVLLSLSQTIEADKKSYYNALEQAQKSNDITAWIKYFVTVTVEAQKHALQSVDFILKKTKFFDRFKIRLNERQLKVVRKMLDAGPEGFEGGMSAKKYISITKHLRQLLQEIYKVSWNWKF
jgi:Fic family protein